jgi:putative addiction module CopG family antidote
VLLEASVYWPNYLGWMALAENVDPWPVTLETVRYPCHSRLVDRGSESGRTVAMTHQLTDQHEALIDRLVATGRVANADQVITEAVTHLEAYERQLDELRAKLQVGLDAKARGDVEAFTPELQQQIRELARRSA